MDSVAPQSNNNNYDGPPVVPVRSAAVSSVDEAAAYALLSLILSLRGDRRPQGSVLNPTSGVVLEANASSDSAHIVNLLAALLRNHGEGQDRIERRVKALLASTVKREQVNPQILPPCPSGPYVQRATLRAAIDKWLMSSDGPLALIACKGMGGVGKSTLALSTIHSDLAQRIFQGRRYWFAQSDQPALLDQQFITLAQSLKLVGSDAAPSQAVAAVISHLESGPPYLFVFDNVGARDSITPYLPKERGHILTTTRKSGWENSLDIDLLSPQEAGMLVTELLGPTPEADLLAETMGYLPRAIHQACAHILAKKISVSNFLSYLKTHTYAFFKEDHLEGISPCPPLLKLWDADLTSLRDHHPNSLALLYQLAYLSPTEIPPAIAEPALLDPLLHYGLLQKGQEGLTIHRLLQKFLQLTQTPSESQKTLGQSADNLLALYARRRPGKAPHRQFASHAEALISFCSDEKTPTLQKLYLNLGCAYNGLKIHRTSLAFFERYLALSRALGDRAGEGAAHRGLGNVHYNLREYRTALEHHEQSLRIAQELGDRADEGRAYRGLGNAYCGLGRYRRAINYYDQSIRIARELGDRADEGHVYRGLGNVHCGLREYRTALEHYQQSLKIFSELGDRAGEGVAHRGLGNVHYNLREYRTALEHYQQSLKIARELGDRAGEQVAYCNLGDAYKSLGQIDPARDCFERAHLVCQDLWGPDHPDTQRAKRQLDSMG